MWLIGGLVILNVAGSFYQAAVYNLWGFYAITLGLQGIFCVLFLMMMISESADTYKMRNAVFLYYLIALTLIPVVISFLAAFGVGWDVVKQICD